MTDTEVGTRIKQLRQAQGWSTNFLAKQCGIAQSFLRAVELGEKGISVESLSLVCRALNISLKDFFDVSAEEDPLEELFREKIKTLTPQQRTALSIFLDTFL